MSWENTFQVAKRLGELDQQTRDNLVALFAANRFLKGALPTKSGAFKLQYENAIVLSDYGKAFFDRPDTSTYSLADIALAGLLVLFRRDFVVDLVRSDGLAVLELLQRELTAGTLRLPYRFGRRLYDRFHEIPTSDRAGHLPAEAVDELLAGSDQGFYQVGPFVTGPLGILSSDDKRYIPSIRSLPLWHCADPGCLHLHDVNLDHHQYAAYTLSAAIKRIADESEGPASERLLPCMRLVRSARRDYYDVATLITDGLSELELRTVPLWH